MGNGKRRQGESLATANLTHSNSTSMSPSRCYKKLTKMSKVSSITCRDQSPLLPHRKVFMITEKSGDGLSHHGTAEPQTSCNQKRKMILIMDEKPTSTTEGVTRPVNGAKCAKIEYENGKPLNGSRTPNPKLLFFANSVDNQLSQKIEEILPEILNRIQWKNGRVVDVNDESAKKNAMIPLAKLKQESQRNSNQNSLRSSVLARVNGTHEVFLTNNIPEPREVTPTEDRSNAEGAPLKVESGDSKNRSNNNSNNSNLMLLGAAAAATAAKSVPADTPRKITLPPKKNLSKLHHQLNGKRYSPTNAGEQIISAATPVIVSTTSLNKPNHPCSAIPNNNNKNNNSDDHLNQPEHQHQHHHYQRHHSHLGNVVNNPRTNPSSNDSSDDKHSLAGVKQENINLTGDFLFLMKMLPLLEKTPEPRKSHVKMLIEKIMKQCVAGEIMEQA